LGLNKKNRKAEGKQRGKMEREHCRSDTWPKTGRERKRKRKGGLKAGDVSRAGSSAI